MPSLMKKAILRLVKITVKLLSKMLGWIITHIRDINYGNRLAGMTPEERRMAQKDRELASETMLMWGEYEDKDDNLRLFDYVVFVRMTGGSI